jgi:hypothetical protein
MPLLASHCEGAAAPDPVSTLGVAQGDISLEKTKLFHIFEL